MLLCFTSERAYLRSAADAELSSHMIVYFFFAYPANCRSSVKRLIILLMVSSFLLLTLSGRRYRPASRPACALHADRQEDTMSHLIRQQGLKGVDLPRSGLREPGAAPDGNSARSIAASELDCYISLY